MAASAHQNLVVNFRRHTRFLLYEQKLSRTEVVDCGAEEQTMLHIVDDCPLRLFADGLTGLCSMSNETVEILSHLDLNL
jgi:hypothetical protein